MVSSFSKKPAVRYLHTDVKPYKLVSVPQFPNRRAVATPNSCGLFPGRDAAAWHFQVPSHEQKGRSCGLPRADTQMCRRASDKPACTERQADTSREG